MSEVQYTKFGRWRVIGPGNTDLMWWCQCECGVEREVNKKNLKAGLSKSCDCYKYQQRAKHGMSGTRTYNIYRGMLARVRINLQYVERGTKVCERWQGEDGFINFLADMGEAPLGLTLDRENNDGHYEPDNCRWADNSTQQRNKSDTRIETYNGKTLPVVTWAEVYGMKRSTLMNRLDRGWSIEKALTTPVGRQRGIGTAPTKDRPLVYRGRTQTVEQWAMEFRLTLATMIQRVWDKWPMDKIAATPQGMQGGHKKARERPQET